MIFPAILKSRSTDSEVHVNVADTLMYIFASFARIEILSSFRSSNATYLSPHMTRDNTVILPF